MVRLFSIFQTRDEEGDYKLQCYSPYEEAPPKKQSPFSTADYRPAKIFCIRKINFVACVRSVSSITKFITNNGEKKIDGKT